MNKRDGFTTFRFCGLSLGELRICPRRDQDNGLIDPHSIVLPKEGMLPQQAQYIGTQMAGQRIKGAMEGQTNFEAEKYGRVIQTDSSGYSPFLV